MNANLIVPTLYQQQIEPRFLESLHVSKEKFICITKTIIESTRGDAILDLVLVSTEDIIDKLVVENKLVLSDHKSVQFKLNGKIIKNRSVTKVSYIKRVGF